jgi:hypothetical protein
VARALRDDVPRRPGGCRGDRTQGLTQPAGRGARRTGRPGVAGNPDKVAGYAPGRSSSLGYRLPGDAGQRRPREPDGPRLLKQRLDS